MITTEEIIEKVCVVAQELMQKDSSSVSMVLTKGGYYVSKEVLSAENLLTEVINSVINIRQALLMVTEDIVRIQNTEEKKESLVEKYNQVVTLITLLSSFCEKLSAIYQEKFYLSFLIKINIELIIETYVSLNFFEFISEESMNWLDDSICDLIGCAISVNPPLHYSVLDKIITLVDKVNSGKSPFYLSMLYLINAKFIAEKDKDFFIKKIESGYFFMLMDLCDTTSEKIDIFKLSSYIELMFWAINNGLFKALPESKNFFDQIIEESKKIKENKKDPVSDESISHYTNSIYFYLLDARYLIEIGEEKSALEKLVGVDSKFNELYDCFKKRKAIFPYRIVQPIIACLAAIKCNITNLEVRNNLEKIFTGILDKMNLAIKEKLFLFNMISTEIDPESKHPFFKYTPRKELSFAMSETDIVELKQALNFLPNPKSISTIHEITEIFYKHLLRLFIKGSNINLVSVFLDNIYKIYEKFDSGQDQEELGNVLFDCIRHLPAANIHASEIIEVFAKLLEKLTLLQDQKKFMQIDFSAIDTFEKAIKIFSALKFLPNKLNAYLFYMKFNLKALGFGIIDIYNYLNKEIFQKIVLLIESLEKNKNSFPESGQLVDRASEVLSESINFLLKAGNEQLENSLASEVLIDKKLNALRECSNLLGQIKYQIDAYKKLKFSANSLDTLYQDIFKKVQSYDKKYLSLYEKYLEERTVSEDEKNESKKKRKKKKHKKVKVKEKAKENEKENEKETEALEENFSKAEIPMAENSSGFFSNNVLLEKKSFITQLNCETAQRLELEEKKELLISIEEALENSQTTTLAINFNKTCYFVPQEKAVALKEHLEAIVSKDSLHESKNNLDFG